MIPDHITPNLTQQRDSWRELGAGAWLFYDFILRHGQYYPGQCLPSRYVRRTPKACFYNTRSLVLRSKRLRYCEGFAMNLRLALPFEHAWALDSRDRVIDPTLADPNLYQFYGVTIERHWLLRDWRWTGVLRDEIGFYRQEVLTEMDPSWAREVYAPELEARAKKHAF